MKNKTNKKRKYRITLFYLKNINYDPKFPIHLETSRWNFPFDLDYYCNSPQSHFLEDSFLGFAAAETSKAILSPDHLFVASLLFL